MSIGPIPPLPPVPTATTPPNRTVESLSAVAPANFGGRDQDSTYTPSHKANRGMEDEEEDGAAEDQEGESVSYSAGEGKISFFA